MLEKRIDRADALEMWHSVTLRSVRDDTPDLNSRQTAILMTVYLKPGPHTVRGLAEQLGVTKAVITRALDTLGGYGFVARERDPADRRSVVIQRTGRGSTYLINLADRIRAEAKLLVQ